LHALAARSELELRLAGRSGRLCSLGLAKTNDDVMAKAQSSREQQENLYKKMRGVSPANVCVRISLNLAIKQNWFRRFQAKTKRAKRKIEYKNNKKAKIIQKKRVCKITEIT